MTLVKMLSLIVALCDEFNLVSSTFRFRNVVSWNLLHIANKINMFLFPNKQIPCTVLYSVSTTTSMVCFHDGQIKNSRVFRKWNCI